MEYLKSYFAFCFLLILFQNPELVVANPHNLKLESVLCKAKLWDGSVAHSVVYDGNDYIYILGGQNRFFEKTDLIQRYSIPDDRIQTIGYLPSPESTGSAVMDSNGDIYYFGGVSDNVYKISNLSAAVAVDHYARLPSWRFLGSAIEWPFQEQDSNSSNNKILLIGGGGRQAMNNSISVDEFDPVSRITTRIHTLPSHCLTSYLHLNTSGKNLMIVSGWPTEVINYDPILNVSKIVATELPVKTQDGAMAAARKYGYVFGGAYNPSDEGKMFQLDFDTLEYKFLPVKNLPGTRKLFFTYPSVVYAGKYNRMFVLGGSLDDRTGTGPIQGLLNEIRYIDLSPLDVRPTTTAAPSTSNPRTDSPSPAQAVIYCSKSNGVISANVIVIVVCLWLIKW